MPLSLIDTDMPPERQLDLAGAGDHLDRLYRAAYALTGSAHEAEDVVQETAARVLARPRGLDAEKQLSHLLTAVRHAFMDIRRRRSDRRVPLDDMSGGPAARTPCGQPEDSFAARETYAAIARLPEPYREVVAAVDIAGLRYREAAVALGLPVGTVMGRLFRAREQLGACAA